MDKAMHLVKVLVKDGHNYYDSCDLVRDVQVEMLLHTSNAIATGVATLDYPSTVDEAIEVIRRSAFRDR